MTLMAERLSYTQRLNFNVHYNFVCKSCISKSCIIILRNKSSMCSLTFGHSRHMVTQNWTNISSLTKPMLTHRNAPVHSANAIVISDLKIQICEMHSRLPEANKLIHCELL